MENGLPELPAGRRPNRGTRGVDALDRERRSAPSLDQFLSVLAPAIFEYPEFPVALNARTR